MKILVIGGDQRSGYLAVHAMKAGWEVETAYLNTFVPSLPGMNEHTTYYDAIMLPYPLAQRNGKLVAPLANEEVEFSQVIPLLRKGRLIVGTKIEGVDLGYFSPSQDESFIIENAAITAEGAVSSAMQYTERTIYGQPCLILGYGRIARFLAAKLSALGGDVTIVARKPTDRTLAQLSGWQATNFDKLDAQLKKSSFIFNTIPKQVISSRQLACISSGALLMELASAPYGFLMEEAIALRINARLESALPGRYAPDAAGKAIFHMIQSQLRKDVGLC